MHLMSCILPLIFIPSTVTLHTYPSSLSSQLVLCVCVSCSSASSSSRFVSPGMTLSLFSFVCLLSSHFYPLDVTREEQEEIRPENTRVLLIFSVEYFPRSFPQEVKIERQTHLFLFKKRRRVRSKDAAKVTLEGDLLVLYAFTSRKKEPTESLPHMRATRVGSKVIHALKWSVCSSRVRKNHWSPEGSHSSAHALVESGEGQTTRILNGEFLLEKTGSNTTRTRVESDRKKERKFQRKKKWRPLCLKGWWCRKRI